MQNILLIMIALMLWLPVPMALAGHDYAGGCPPYVNVPINVTAVFEEPRLDNRVGLADIQGIAADATRSIPHTAKIVTLGFTQYSPILEFSAPLLIRQMRDGNFCSIVQHVDARIGYRDSVVYVAREFPQGSCAFNHVLEHEAKHIAVNRQLLEEFSRIAQSRLTQFMQQYGATRVASAAHAEQQLQRNINVILQEISTEMLAENQRRQQIIDSPQEYARNDTACNGAINAVSRRFVR